MSAADEQVRLLLEEALNSERTPEEVCGENPELLHEVQRRWRRIQNLADEIERVFPSSDGSGEVGFGAADAIPDIPGYVIESVIGHGGMGVVYKARHIKLDRVVALKMLRGGDRASPRELASLLREARAIAGLKHPHIVEVYDVNDLGRNGVGLPYFTMEYVDTGSLARKLHGKPLPAKEAATILASLAEAVQAAHAGGIVHRDLKPANILMAQNGCPKIADFGLARRTNGDPANTLSAAGAGTPSYMAPEQALGTPEAFGPSVDVYALGALLYEMLVGKPPFCGGSNAETQRRVIAEDPTPPSRLHPKTPRDLEIICLKCLQKLPSRRYGTARELSEEVGRFLRGEPIKARAVGPMERARKWVRRHPGYSAAVIATSAAIMAVVGAMLWTLSQRATIERAVTEDLAEVVRLERVSDWLGARNTLERAKTRLEAAAGRQQLALTASHIERELDLVARLGQMRFDQRASAALEFNKVKWWDQYRDVFMNAGFLVEGDTSDAFAARIARSPARVALVSAMDDMSACSGTDADREWLLRATRLADPDPWRDKARDTAVWNNPEALARLAREAPVEIQPAVILLNVAGLLLDRGSPEAEALIKRVQAAHPSDFWANFALAETLDARNDVDAIGYYRAAIALRPEAGAAHYNLANVLASQERIGEAIETMGRAAKLDPRNWAVHYSLAAWLLREQRAEAALVHARIATEIDHPHQRLSMGVLGSALAKLGRHCEAVEPFRRALELTPGDEQLQKRLERVVRACENASSEKPPATEP